MGRKKTRYSHGSFQSWQSAVENDIYYFVYSTMLERLALARFKWHNLPKTLENLAIERELLLRGSVSIAGMNGDPNLIYALPWAQIGNPDAYMRPRRWRTTSPYARNYEANQNTGIVCFENIGNLQIDSASTMRIIDMFARELADLARTRQVNRSQQKQPFLIQVPRELESVANSLLSQKYGNEPAIISTSNLNDLVKIEVFPVAAPYMAELFNSDEKNLWARVYQALGIDNLAYKAERQIQDEVLSQKEPTTLSALSFLESRNIAARHINGIYGTNIYVTQNSDIINDIYQWKFNPMMETRDNA